MLAKDAKTGNIDQSVVSRTAAWSGPMKARSPLALSEEVTRPSLKKAGHVIVHFVLEVKLHLRCNFVSVLRDVYFT